MSARRTVPYVRPGRRGHSPRESREQQRPRRAHVLLSPHAWAMSLLTAFHHAFHTLCGPSPKETLATPTRRRSRDAMISRGCP